MWSCQRCTFLNDEPFTRCKMCGTKKCPEDFGAFGGGGAETDPTYNDFETVNEIRIVLIGRTGSGKSATGNSILRKKHFESLVSGSSVTSKCKRGETFRRGKMIIVVDTPGLFDTGMTNEKVTKEIVKCIGMTSPGPHAMVLVAGIGRFTKEEQDTVVHFVDHFGEGMLRYLIVLFTKKDELSKSSQSIHQFVQTVPMELKTILNHCGNRYIAFNNNAVGREQETQQDEFFDMVEMMLGNNGHACYTSEIYQDAEATLQRRMHQQRENLERQKKREQDEIRLEVESKYELKLEKEILEKSRLEEKLNDTKRLEQKANKKKEALTNELKSLRQQFTASSRDAEEKKKMGERIESLQKDLCKVKQRNYKQDQAKLQIHLDEANMRHQRELEEKNKEIERLSKLKDDEYKRKTDEKTLRREERDKIENENPGIVDDLVAGVKRIGQGLYKAFRHFGFKKIK